MKKLYTALLLIGFGAAAGAQERVVGVALERYGVIAGAWWLNQKCKLLSVDDTAAFTRDVAVINVSLASTLDNPKVIGQIQASGKKTSETEPYASCLQQAQEIVSYAAPAAARWAGEVRHIVLDAANRLPGPK
jgi:hypothetical protein